MSLIHFDVKKLGRIPDGGGWRLHGRGQRPARKRGLGYDYVHTVIDDHSRVAYAEICSDEKADTAIGVLRRAVSWFADRGVTVERVLSDNGSAYKSRRFARLLRRLKIKHIRTRPYTPNQWQG